MSRSSRTRIAVATVVTAFAAALALAATTPGAPVARTQDSGSFTMLMNLAYKPGFDILIANFNRVYPNIKVSPTYLSVGGTSPYPTVLATQLAAGNAPDVVWTIGGTSGPHYTQILAQGNYLEPLGGRKWEKRLLPSTKPDYMVGGKLYGSEIGLSVLSLLMYNKDYFTQNNLQVPKNFSQLLGLCRTIAGKGKIPISWGAQTAAVNTNNLVSLAAATVAAKDPTWFQKRLNKTTTFEGTPGWRRALQQIVALKGAGCFRQGAEAVSFANMAGEFASGSAVMAWTTPILLGTAATLNPNIKYGLFPPPGDGSALTRVVVQPQGALSLLRTASPEAKAAALTFIDFVAREKQARLLARVNFLISSFDALKGNLPTSYGDLAPYFSSNKVLNTPTARWPNTQFSTLAGTSIQGLFTGQKTVDDVLKDMDKAYELS